MAAEQDEQDEQYQEAKRRVEARKGFYIHAFFFALINIILLAVVGWDFLWATVFWGLGLVLHGASVFFSASDWVKSWEHRAIQKELERQRGAARGTTGTRRTPPPSPPPAADATQPKPTAPRAGAAEKKT